jgi:hypothetical protein
MNPVCVVWCSLSSLSVVVLVPLWIGQLLVKVDGKRQIRVIRSFVCFTGILAAFGISGWSLQGVQCLLKYHRDALFRVLELLLVDATTAVMLVHLLSTTYTVFLALHVSAFRLMPTGLNVCAGILVVLTFLSVFLVNGACYLLDRLWPRALFFWWQISGAWIGLVVAWCSLWKLFAILQSATISSQLLKLRCLMGICTLVVMLATYPMVTEGKELFEDKEKTPVEMEEGPHTTALIFSALHVCSSLLSLWWYWYPLCACCKEHNSTLRSLPESSFIAASGALASSLSSVPLVGADSFDD